MAITLDLARQINDRVTWDCIINPFRSRIVEPEGYSLESGLKWAMTEALHPRLIILPWCLADVLLWHERQRFERGGSLKDWEHKRALWDVRPLSDRTWGCVGEYHGVDVLASGLTDYAWVTSERDPAFIGGNNTVFLKVMRRRYENAG